MSAAFEVLAWNDLAASLMEDFADPHPPRPQPGPQGLPWHRAAERAQLYGISDDVDFRHGVVKELRIAPSPGTPPTRS